ncbi:MAG TPA: TetR/AcrR family transcriptional regulator [Actinomycetota bacterium]|jgi:AcrR family transcriptional regulator|nr:TetR/AcrR family transcriptional regulator [Actinomycetota bacterium]
MGDRLTLPQRSARQTRQRILAAARGVFAERGYAVATMDEIAAAAGASKGALYHHFATKEELFRALLDDHGAEVDAFAAAVRQAVSFHDLLDRLVGQWLEHYLADAEFVPLSLEVRVQARRQAWFAEEVRRQHGGLRDFLREVVVAATGAGLVPPGVDPTVAAVLLFGLLDGVCLQGGVTPGEIDLDRLRGDLVAAVERLLSVDPVRADQAAGMDRLRQALEPLLAARRR